MIINKVYKGTTPFVKGYKGTTVIFEEGGLPSAYQQVEYIQSTSNWYMENYIDTGHQCTKNTRVTLRFSIDASFNDYGRLWGIGDDSPHTEILNFGAYNQDYHWRWNNSEGTFNPPGTNVITECSLGKRVGDVNASFMIDGQNENIFGNLDFITTSNVFLFHGVDRDGAYKLYGCTITEDDVLVRDFVPCYIKATNEVGLYDLVTKEFYHNLGSVPFIAGGNV